MIQVQKIKKAGPLHGAKQMCPFIVVTVRGFTKLSQFRSWVKALSFGFTLLLFQKNQETSVFAIFTRTQMIYLRNIMSVLG